MELIEKKDVYKFNLKITGKYGKYYFEDKLNTILAQLSMNINSEREVDDFFDEIKDALKLYYKKNKYFISDLTNAKLDQGITEYYGKTLAEVFYENNSSGLIRISPVKENNSWELAAFFGDVPTVVANNLDNAVDLVYKKIKTDSIVL